MKYKIASFSRIWKLSDLRHVNFWTRLGVLEKSTDCHSRGVPERCTPPEDLCHDHCRPCVSPMERDPCPKPPTYYSDPRKLIFWRILSLFVALPMVVIMSMITYTRVKEEAKRPREPFLDLPYMCRRTKPFPWGDGNHTLFHNPVKNPVPPYGYEVEDPNAAYKKPDN